jgi:hypothetical protein
LEADNDVSGKKLSIQYDNENSGGIRMEARKSRRNSKRRVSQQRYEGGEKKRMREETELGMTAQSQRSREGCFGG